MAGSTFEALDDFLDEGLTLPVRGKDGTTRVYHINPSAEAGLKVERIASYVGRLVAGGEVKGGQVLDDDEELDLYRLCLGDCYDRLKRETSWTMFKRVALTAMYWILNDDQAAHEYWTTGEAPGKAQGNRQTRRQTSRDSSAKGAVNGTPSPASTSGTRAASQRRRGGRGRGPRPT